MDRMNVTITTDASYFYSEKVGGYAFQINSNDGIIRKWGPLDGKIYNPTVAELRSLLNALTKVSQKDYKIAILTINVDCLFIVNSVAKGKIGKHSHVKEFSKKILNILKKLNYTDLRIKHVKAHSEITSARRYVNNWCDEHSRKGCHIAKGMLNGKTTNNIPEDCSLN
jgi:ribonuclease HI